MVIPGDNSGKRADSAAERGIRAYDFDFIVFLYAFPCENGVLKRFRAGKRTAAHAGSRGVVRSLRDYRHLRVCARAGKGGVAG